MPALSIFGYFCLVVGYECESVEGGILQRGVRSCVVRLMKKLFPYVFRFVVGVHCETVKACVHHCEKNLVVLMCVSSALFI